MLKDELIPHCLSRLEFQGIAKEFNIMGMFYSSTGRPPPQPSPTMGEGVDNCDRGNISLPKLPRELNSFGMAVSTI